MFDLLLYKLFLEKIGRRSKTETRNSDDTKSKTSIKQESDAELTRNDIDDRFKTEYQSSMNLSETYFKFKY